MNRTISRKGIPNHYFSHTRFYRCWYNMKRRCDWRKHKSWKYYGGKGIKVCDEWKSFLNFKRDMFDSYEEGLTLDRIDSNGNYEPSNCKWSTLKEQANNTSKNTFISYRGESKTLAQWSDKLGIKRSTLVMRLYTYNYPIERVLTPTRHGKYT